MSKDLKDISSQVEIWGKRLSAKVPRLECAPWKLSEKPLKKPGFHFEWDERHCRVLLKGVTLCAPRR